MEVGLTDGDNCIVALSNSSSSSIEILFEDGTHDGHSHSLERSCDVAVRSFALPESHGVASLDDPIPRVLATDYASGSVPPSHVVTFNPQYCRSQHASDVAHMGADVWRSMVNSIGCTFVSGSRRHQLLSIELIFNTGSSVP